MQLPDHILGKNAVQTIKDRIQAPVLVIGSDKFTRGHLASLNCFNFLAAATLSNVLTHHLKVKNVSDLFYNFAPSTLALPGLGVISLATLGAAFEQRLGKTLSDYIDRHRGEHDVVTFATIKAQSADSKAEKLAKKEERKRKRSRNRQAHEHRVKRFVERATKPTNPATQEKA